MKRSSTFAVIGFFSGFLFGVVFAGGIGIVATQQDYWKQQAVVRIGGLLDTDMLYLKDGQVLRGRIVSETAGALRVQTGEKIRDINREDVDKIDYNFYTRYMKELW
ncbi:MAG TPA: hypothetical protein PKL97_07140 [Candidatus Omnitrophota bacterium]|nr:hypothetical protein [Candidatus Omnitrophota bacterium]